MYPFVSFVSFKSWPFIVPLALPTDFVYSIRHGDAQQRDRAREALFADIKTGGQRQ